MKITSLIRVSITLFIHLFFCELGTSQVIYLSSIENDLYTLDVQTCQIQLLIRIDATAYDISFHPDGSLYGLNGSGELYEINESTGETNVIAEFDGQTFNSLTISGDEVAYAAGTDGTFGSYDFKTGEVINRGNLGFNPTGDLTFFDGQLYAACSNDRIIKVEIDAPATSSIFIQEDLDKPIWGIVSYAEECDDISTYAVTGEESDIYVIDFENKALSLVCELDITVTGGASTSEFRESNPLAIDSIATSDPDCAGNGGIIEIFATGGSNNYTYDLNFQQSSLDSLYDDLESGEYIVSVFDGFCEVVDTVEIDFLNNLAIEDIIVDNATCDIDNGSAIIVMEVDNPSLTFTIDGVTFQNSSQFSDLPASNYFVLITDDGQCINTATFSIEQSGTPSIDNIATEIATCDNLDGKLEITTSGGVSPYEHSIDGGVSYQGSNIFTDLDSREYSIFIKDANNCISETSTTIDRLGNPSIDDIETSIDYCRSGVGTIDIAATGLGTLQYRINDNDFGNDNTFEGLRFGNYQVSVRDSLGCETNMMTNILPSEPPSFSNLVSNRTDCNMSNGSLTFDIADGEGTLDIYLDDELIEIENAIENLLSGDYNLTVIDSLGCEGVVTFSIGREGCTVFIPNVFSPNGDQNNDDFKIIPQNGFDGEVVSFNIYDRWGQPVFSNTDNQFDSWDGTVGGQVVSPGVYVYMVAVIHFDGREELFKGDLTVLD